MPREPTPTSLDSRITRKVKQSPPGTVFTPGDFAAMGGSKAVGKCLEWLVKRNELRWLVRGLYDKPRHDEVLGILWPSPDAVIKAITDKNKIRVQPAGVHAANMLGLSEQVPAKYIFLTDGGSRMVKAGPMRIALRHTSPRNMAAAGRFTGLLIQAFKSLGVKHIDKWHLARLKKTVPVADRLGLLNDLDLAPAWMRPLFMELAGQKRSRRMKELPERPEP
ncbi:MAG: DUF6088 family protein [Fibrobacterota bacterium]|nr:DUF6088 family protein [Fibrobacterota bacterium]